MKDDVNFLYEIGTLRFIQRTWRQFLNPHFVNVAEHTFRVIWIALVLAKNEKVKNTEKIIKMALVHDITESRTGDVHYLSRQYVKRDEEKAIRDMLKDTTIEKEFMALWKEYERRETIESKIVKDADILHDDFELQEQAMAGMKYKKWPEYRKHVADNFLYTKSAKKLWKMLQKTNPNDWHLTTNNRINSGDWKK